MGTVPENESRKREVKDERRLNVATRIGIAVAAKALWELIASFVRSTN